MLNFLMTAALIAAVSLGLSAVCDILLSDLDVELN